MMRLVTFLILVGPCAQRGSRRCSVAVVTSVLQVCVCIGCFDACRLVVIWLNVCVSGELKGSGLNTVLAVRRMVM